MAQPQLKNAKTHQGAGSPPLCIHNFTNLEFPDHLPDGRPLEFRKSSSLKDIYPFSVLVISPESLAAGQDYEFLFQHVGVMLWDPGEMLGSPSWVDVRLSPRPSGPELQLACAHMVRLLELKEQCLVLHNTSAITEARNRQLNQIGIALMSEKNLETLLNLILDKAMALTSSDAGCLYLVEPVEGAEESPGDYWSNKRIRFKLTRNHSVTFNFSEMVVPATKSSIVGFTLLEGKPLNIPDVYAIDPSQEYRHNNGFDRNSGYRTRSMLTLPMKDHHNQVIGAIQLINKCRTKARPITSLEAADEQVAAYRADDQNMSLSLASQASVAILNAQYERDIKNLFEGFIKASVTAIESRDPTTSGHSHRVGAYCVKLAQAVGRETSGPFRALSFSETQLRELRYAALLHDFGKIGVREHILTKAKKLFPEELERIRLRTEYIKRTINWESALAKVQLLRAGGPDGMEAALLKLDEEESLSLREVDTFFDSIRGANEPMRLQGEMHERLLSLGSRTYRDAAGELSGYLQPEELARLIIPRGTLSDEERLEIQSHVSHTYKFLAQIPWTKDLKLVPEIAHAHHEKLDGSGYPRSLTGPAIPLPSQIMTICDIFDALAASDRPYKKALPPDRALDILSEEVKAGKINGELFRIFVQAEVYREIG